MNIYSSFTHSSQKSGRVRCLWLTPVILATQEAEIRRIMVQSQPREIVRETLSQKYPQGVGPEFKPKYHTKKKKTGRNQDVLW
jgi:hypothetical protein